MKLYKRNAANKPIVWEINRFADGIKITHGLLGGNLHEEYVHNSLIKSDGYDSRIEAKRKEGYKELSELWDNAPIDLSDDIAIKSYLEQYLPKYNTTNKGFVLPMLCKTLEDNKPFTKGKYFGQWKINGVRCIIKAEKVPNNLFKYVRFRYYSREGNEFNLDWFDDIILASISPTLISMMLEEGVMLDGELYIPGYLVNDINSFVKNNKLPQHKDVQFWMYDLCMENTTAAGRQDIIEHNITTPRFSVFTKGTHLNNTNHFITLSNYTVNDINIAIMLRDSFIDYGFEGLVIRKEDEEYQFGKRNKSMMKYKKIVDGLFTIVDIVPEGKRSNLPKFVLRNDINDELFEVTMNTPHEVQEAYFNIKDTLINKTMQVEYRERSGVKQVPFHAKGVKLIV